MRVAFVVEGTTDYAVLSAFVRREAPTAALTLIRPRRDRTARGPREGVSAVRDYLIKKGRDLDLLLRYGSVDRLILHVDGDVAGGACLPDAEAQWEALNRRLLEWAGREAWPAGVVRAFTLQNLEAWVCAARPCETQDSRLECERDPANKLRDTCDRSAARRKRTDYYEDVFAPAIVEHWARVRQRCPVGSGHFEADWRACCEEAL